MHNMPPINARYPASPSAEVALGESPTSSHTRLPSSLPASRSGPSVLEDLPSLSGRGLSEVPADVMMQIAGYLPTSDLKNMRLATAQLKDAAESQMSLLINGGNELQNLMGSENFRHPKQVTLIGTYEAGNIDSLRTAVKGKFVDLRRRPGEGNLEYVDRQIKQGATPVAAVNNAGLRLESDSPTAKRVNYEQYRMFGAHPKEALAASGRVIPPPDPGFGKSASEQELIEDHFANFYRHGIDAHDAAALLELGHDKGLIAKMSRKMSNWAVGIADGSSSLEVMHHFMENPEIWDRYAAHADKKYAS